MLRFPNVSAHHCQLTINGGYWYVKDLGSRNGVKVNDVRVTERRLDPGDSLAVAKHEYEVKYSPVDLGAVGPPPNDDQKSAIFGRSLLERAGLAGKKGLAGIAGSVPLDKPEKGRYDVLSDEAGQIKDPNRPL